MQIEHCAKSALITQAAMHVAKSAALQRGELCSRIAVGRRVSRCVNVCENRKIHTASTASKMVDACGTLCQFLARLNFLEKAPRPNERKGDVIAKRGPERGAGPKGNGGCLLFTRRRR